MHSIPTQQDTSFEIVEINYSPHKYQRVVHGDSARFRVVACGRRWGKTTLAINEIIKEALIGWDKNIFFVAPTYRQAKMIAFEMVKKYLPPSMVTKINEVDLEFNLINGSRVSLKGAENEDSLRGVGLDFVVIDEYSQIKQNVWPEIIRPMLTDTKGRALFIGTPKGKNSFFDLYLKGERNEDGYKSFLFKTIDNPFIEPAEVEEAKKQLSERYFRQEYEASFEDYVGLVWPEFSRSHIIDPVFLPGVYSRLGSIDPAMSGTSAVLKSAIDEDGNIIVYSEYYQQNVRVSDVVEQVKEENVRWTIDPASAEKSIQKEGKLYSLFNEYRDNGIVAYPAENDVDAGINRVGEMFKAGKIKIFNTCRNLIYELERYHWSEEKETRTGFLKPKPYKSEDHLCDCLRYIVMARKDKSSLVVPQVISHDSPLAHLNELKRRREEFVH